MSCCSCQCTPCCCVVSHRCRPLARVPVVSSEAECLGSQVSALEQRDNELLALIGGAGFATRGMMVIYAQAHSTTVHTAPPGWIRSGFGGFDRTIGSDASGSTYPSEETFDLFSLLWPIAHGLSIFTSAGDSASRGASALADWNDNKRLNLPIGVCPVAPGFFIIKL